jgi:hypothetical protein
MSGAFDENSALCIPYAAGEGEPDAFGLRDPQFDRQQIVIAGGTFEGEPAFDDGKDGIPLLQRREGVAEFAEEFPPGKLQDVEKPRMIHMIPDGAERVADSMLKAIDLSRHGARVERAPMVAN